MNVKGKLLYEGKAKAVYAYKSSQLWVDFKDSLTAFNAQKKGSFENKGALNRDIASLIFRYLIEKGIENHWISDEGTTGMIVKELKIIPIEVVVRNILAGSTAKKLGLAEGWLLKKPLVEFYYKNDELQDPFVSDDQIMMLELASEGELKEIKHKALQVNLWIQRFFKDAKINLVDFKIEFGRDAHGKIILADEVTPDCCRLWDQDTNEKMDKDRFRRDLGQVKENYEKVLRRLRESIE